jgi:uncharacterized protein YigE (DUF2233 family)
MMRYGTTLRSYLVTLLSLAPALAPALDCSTIDFQGTRSTVCHVDVRKDHLKLFLYDGAGAPFNSFRRVAESLDVQHEQLAFAMNAGMFREDYSPVGLLVMEGRQIHRLNLASGFGNFYLKPNGVFVLDPAGARIVETLDYRSMSGSISGSISDPPRLATQSGPLLVHGGQINAALNPQGTSRLIRNGVGVVSTDQVVFAISDDPVSFYDFALLFRDRLKCPEALFLDGSVSSMYVRSLGRDDQHTPLGPIIGVTVTAR